MSILQYRFELDGATQTFEMVFVQGTRGRPYSFGEGNLLRQVEVQDYLIARFPTTQALWTHVMGVNPAIRRGSQRPVENISWLEITQQGGFLDHINDSEISTQMAKQFASDARFRFRLPSETEWEYAARGGPLWEQGFRFSGSNDVEAVAWYKDNSGDSMHDVGLKSPNQLGLHDMSGNAWEWCQDCHTPDVSQVPTDGSPFISDCSERSLRGGCFHNWAIHCTVSKRYEIGAEYRDGCIGFRLAMSV